VTIINKILITGGAGFIGSHVVDATVERYPDAEITVLDKMNYAANVHFILKHVTARRVDLVVGDVADFPAMIDATRGVDLVLHLAAESHVGRSFANSMEFTRTNTLGTHVLLEAAQQNKVKRFVHVSTDEVYGEILDRPATEAQPLHPNNPYSGSKAAAEMIIQSYWRSFRAPIVISRANNIFGTRQFPEKIIPRFICRALAGETLPIHGDGRHMRHYLAAQDFAKALLLTAQEGELGLAYNIGGADEYSNLDVAKMICETIGIDPDKHIEFEADRPFNDRRYAVDWSRIQTMGWKPERRLKDSLADMVGWYKENYHLFKRHLEGNYITEFKTDSAGAAAT